MLLKKIVAGGMLALIALTSWAKELVEIPVGISPVMSSAALYIALEKSYFEEQGIKINLNPFKDSGAKMVPFLASGQLYVAGGNINAGMYNAIASDIPIKMVADKGTVTRNHGYLALIVRKDLVDDGRFKSFSDLKGMTMAITAKGVSQEIATERFLKKVGLALTDISMQTLAYADMNIAFANKSLDATVQIEPFVTVAVEKGLAVRIAGDDEVYPDQQSAAMFYSPIFIEKHPDLAKGFMVAYVKGLRDYNDAFEKNKNKSEIIAILQKHAKLEDKTIFERVVPVGLHPDGQMNIASLKEDAKWYREKDYVKELPNIDAIVDTRFIDHAVSVLGLYRD